MNLLIKKADTIRDLALSSIFAFIVAFILLVFLRLFKIHAVTIVSSVFMGLAFFIAYIMQLIASIQILSTDWKDTELNSSKVLWGLLGIFLLGWIASLIFCIQAKNCLTQKASNQATAASLVNDQPTPPSGPTPTSTPSSAATIVTPVAPILHKTYTTDELDILLASVKQQTSEVISSAPTPSKTFSIDEVNAMLDVAKKQVQEKPTPTTRKTYSIDEVNALLQTVKQQTITPVAEKTYTADEVNAMLQAVKSKTSQAPTNKQSSNRTTSSLGPWNADE